MLRVVSADEVPTAPRQVCLDVPGGGISRRLGLVREVLAEGFDDEVVFHVIVYS